MNRYSSPELDRPPLQRDDGESFNLIIRNIGRRFQCHRSIELKSHSPQALISYNARWPDVITVVAADPELCPAGMNCFAGRGNAAAIKRDLGTPPKWIHTTSFGKRREHITGAKVGQ